MKWRSQLGQDRWVVETLAGMSNGYFVDVGAADGVALSNTYTLETEFGWTGIAVEAHDEYYASLKMNRTCVCVHACVMGNVRNVRFREAGYLSGVEECFNVSAIERLRVEGFSDGLVSPKVSRTLEEILTSHNAPPVIDFLSLDTEGSESEILGAFPFDRYRFRTICVEHNGFPEPMRVLRAILGGYGYELAATVGGQDDYWVGLLC